MTAVMTYVACLGSDRSAWPSAVDVTDWEGAVVIAMPLFLATHRTKRKAHA